MSSPIRIQLEGLPLRTTLRLALDQIGLDYRVRDGLVYITDRSSLFEEEAQAAQAALLAEARARGMNRGAGMSGMGAGMGGMGGGMGGMSGGMGGMGGGMGGPGGGGRVAPGTAGGSQNKGSGSQ